MKPHSELNATIRVITATQFLIMALGAAMMNIHLRIVSEHNATDLELFLARRALWLMFIPLLWRGLAALSERLSSGIPLRIAVLLGQIMIAAMLATYWYAIYGKG